MTKEERAQEIERLASMKGDALRAEGYRTYADVHKRLDELVGRPIFTHEMARPDLLAQEVRTGNRPGIGEIIGKIHDINPDAEVIVVTPPKPPDA